MSVCVYIYVGMCMSWYLQVNLSGKGGQMLLDRPGYDRYCRDTYRAGLDVVRLEAFFQGPAILHARLLLHTGQEGVGCFLARFGLRVCVSVGRCVGGEIQDSMFVIDLDLPFCSKGLLGWWSGVRCFIIMPDTHSQRTGLCLCACPPCVCVCVVSMMDE